MGKSTKERFFLSFFLHSLDIHFFFILEISSNLCVSLLDLFLLWRLSNREDDVGTLTYSLLFFLTRRCGLVIHMYTYSYIYVYMYERTSLSRWMVRRGSLYLVLAWNRSSIRVSWQESTYRISIQVSVYPP